MAEMVLFSSYLPVPKVYVDCRRSADFPWNCNTSSNLCVCTGIGVLFIVLGRTLHTREGIETAQIEE